jgi:glycosyltransferase involved in cell wall biosynthesis
MARADIAVIVTTYNQKKFIGQCISSVLAQKTSAKFTVYVHDDCSSDGTQSVIDEYARRFPGKVIPVLSNINKLSNRKSPILDMVRLVEEEYIAFCNGDDYWTDPNKLEYQLEKLLGNSRAGIVHTAFMILNEELVDAKPEREPINLRVARSKVKNAYDFVIGCQVKESSVMIRKSKVDFVFLLGANHLRASDWILYLSISLKSEIIFIDKEMLVHRYTEQGVWNGARLEHREHMKDEVRWYAASNCPDIELRQLFRDRVTQDFLLTKIKKKGILRLLLRITEPLRHPIRIIKKSVREFYIN